MNLDQLLKQQIKYAYENTTATRERLDAQGLTPDDSLAPFSLVCKAVSANGHPTVKLSDNPRKAMGPADQVDRYKRVFGVGEQERLEVVV